jgi:cytochrome o ubiquinol oxidase subunit II
MAQRPVFFMLLFTAIILLVVLLMQPFSVYHFQEKIALLFPSGAIAVEQRNLLLIIQALMLLVIIPVYVLTFIFSWKYRAGNPRAKYEPDLVDSTLAEYIWWGVPLIMTLIVGGLTWIKTHELDPYKPIHSDNKPITVQVVALQWKWLFIYPEEKIASVNFLQIPENTPIRFEITADAPMNSFWIPDLGGQIYAMPNMRTELNLIANKTGDFRGSSANLSGEGFASMHFITRASTEKEFQAWVEGAQKSSQTLTAKAYDELAKPSRKTPLEVFRTGDENIFHHVMEKYMPKKGSPT